MLARLGAEANAAQCGSTAAGFETWKREFAEEARTVGSAAPSIAALLQANYATATIAADRGQRSFGLSPRAVSGRSAAPAAIVARGRSLKQSQAALFASIQQRYGVPPGPLIAIWGMETGFGSQRGNQNMLSSIATLAYDCRRTEELFTEFSLMPRWKLIDRGSLSASTRGSMHGELGQTQFLPKNILAYGTGNLDVAANALSSTANFLRAHGWRAGAGYQPGEANFAAIEAWNAAGVYQKAIALMGRQIAANLAAAVQLLAQRRIGALLVLGCADHRDRRHPLRTRRCAGAGRSRTIGAAGTGGAGDDAQCHDLQRGRYDRDGHGADDGRQVPASSGDRSKSSGRGDLHRRRVVKHRVQEIEHETAALQDYISARLGDLVALRDRACRDRRGQRGDGLVDLVHRLFRGFLAEQRWRPVRGESRTSRSGRASDRSRVRQVAGRPRASDAVLHDVEGFNHHCRDTGFATRY